MFLISNNYVLRVKKLLIIFDRGERLRLLGLLGLMVIGAAFEVVGIGIVTAFIGVITNPDLITQHRVLRWFYDRLGAGSVRDFAIYTGAALFAVFVVKNTYLAFLVYTQTRFALHKEVMLSKRLLAAYLSNPYTFHLQRNSAELLKNIAQAHGPHRP